jgi:hypothetical protein
MQVLERLEVGGLGGSTDRPKTLQWQHLVYKRELRCFLACHGAIWGT